MIQWKRPEQFHTADILFYTSLQCKTAQCTGTNPQSTFKLKVISLQYRRIPFVLTHFLQFNFSRNIANENRWGSIKTQVQFLDKCSCSLARSYAEFQEELWEHHQKAQWTQSFLRKLTRTGFNTQRKVQISLRWERAGRGRCREISTETIEQLQDLSGLFDSKIRCFINL